jgi:hypothetical protein
MPLFALQARVSVTKGDAAALEGFTQVALGKVIDTVMSMLNAIGMATIVLMKSTSSSRGAPSRDHPRYLAANPAISCY